MKVNGICIGSDKLGHFFQQGATYFNTEAASGRPAAEEESERSEGGGFGLATTGVFSNADQEANRQGGRFYRDLTATPTMAFDLANYISARWNEESNPNFYEDSVGRQVWANLLTGPWTGTSWAGVPHRDEPLNLALRATTAGVVSGTISAGAAGAGGLISGGRLTMINRTVRGTDFTGLRNTSPTAITGVRIAFDWSLGTDSGKGFLESTDEHHLVGRWGHGSSDTNKGRLDLTR
jgi:hypothetical protein